MIEQNLSVTYYFSDVPFIGVFGPRYLPIIKPVSEDGSIGIDSGSVVESVKELMERIHYIHEEFDSPALIEEYIEGREIYAAILGNENAEVLPLIELDLSKLPKGTPRIATSARSLLARTRTACTRRHSSPPAARSRPAASHSS